MDVFSDGSGDMDSEVLAGLDLVLGAFHSKLRDPNDVTFEEVADAAAEEAAAAAAREVAEADSPEARARREAHRLGSDGS